jgi:hypothetical protein
MGFSQAARSLRDRVLCRWIRIERILLLAAFSASGLIAGKNDVNDPPRFARASRARKV